MTRPTAANEFERIVQAWLAGDAPAAAPQDLPAAILKAAAARRQRPAWLARIRLDQGWQPPRVAVPSATRSLQVAVVLLLLALAAALLVAASGQEHRRPAPLSGPAGNGLLAFEAGGQIVTTNADGSGRRVITAGDASRSTPIWSPDGLHLAFWSRPAAGGGVALSVVDVDGGRARVISGPSPFNVPSVSTRDAVWPSAPDWSRDGTRLAFSATVDGTNRILIATLDGAPPKVIGDPDLPALSPVWSPDGGRIAFAGGRYPQTALYVMNADGTEGHPLTTAVGAPGSFIAASWSPDGQHLAYQAGATSLFHAIWLVRADGDGEFSPDTGPDGARVDDLWPTWSPDGRFVAFVRTVDQLSAGRCTGLASCPPDTSVTRPQLFVMDADGSNLHGLLDIPIDNAPPAWSPDGSRIVVAATVDGVAAGYAVVDPSGMTPPTVVAAGASGGEWVSWERVAP